MKYLFAWFLGVAGICYRDLVPVEPSLVTLLIRYPPPMIFQDRPTTL
jgi:hypothetical protein